MIRGGEDTYLELKVKLSNPERISQEIVALANTGGGTMIFGVTDQLRIEGVRNPESVQEELTRLCREEIYPPILPLIDVVAFDNGRRIVALEVGGDERPYRTRDGKFYIRVGAEKLEADREAISGLIREARPLRYENMPLPDFDASDFDDSLLWSFAAEFDEGGRPGELYRTESFLKKDLLLAVSTGDRFLPTLAGVLLFARNEPISEKLPASAVTLRRYSGKGTDSDLVEEKVVNGNLLTVYEEIVAFVTRYCDLRKHRRAKREEAEDSPVESRREYHVYSVYEAVANLLIHRDYALFDISSTVFVFDDSIEFTNPRRTQGFVPPASRAIRFGITQRVNPQIASIFLRREYGLRLPHGGLPMIIKQSRLFSDKRVGIHTANDTFRLQIYGRE